MVHIGTRILLLRWLGDGHHIPGESRPIILGVMSGTYRDLKVWQTAMEMVQEVYRLNQAFPRQETYGLTIQLRRAAVSIASNTAEGKGRSSDKELLHFLSNAKGSLFEVETQIMIADGLGYLTHKQGEELLSRTAEVGRLLNGLMKAFRTFPAA